MTDTEIIKALECCVSRKNSCNGCPMHTMNCTPRVPMAFALDLINRQKAEIERLKAKKKLYFDRWGESIKLAQFDRDDAIREFAVRVKELVPNHINCGFVNIHDKIDTLVKELTEESDE